jgi:sugar lactone lactonase YvrE
MPPRTLGRCLAGLACLLVLWTAVPAQGPGKLALVAGNGKGGDGPAHLARLLTPYGAGFDAQGNLYVGEIYGHKVRKIDRDGNMTTIAGTGEKGYGGDGGPALQAKFWEIHDLVVAKNGDVYVADSFNYRIRKIDAKSGLVTLIAGTGKKEHGGDGGPAVLASLDGTAALALDAKEEKLYTTGFSKRLRVVDLKTGIIDTVAGIPGGRCAAVGAKGHIYVGKGDTVHMLEPGQTMARIVLDKNEPPMQVVAMCVDRDDNLVLADMKSQAIRRYTPATGKLTILVGAGKRGNGGLKGPPLQAELKDPHGVCFSPAGMLYFTDSFNYRVVRVEP